MEKLLRQNVQSNPHGEAVVDGGRGMTYSQLLAAASQLSHKLGEKAAIQPGDPIGILLVPSLEQVVAQVAIRMLGATCVPIEPSMPPKRVHEMLTDVNACWVIVGKGNHTHHFDSINVFPIVDLAVPEDGTASQTNGIHQTNGGSYDGGRGRSHILFTSGSTGRPKPVQIQESSIVHLSTNLALTRYMGKANRVAAFNNPGFDLSLFEIWTTLLTGGTVVIVPKNIATDPTRLPDFLAHSRINVMLMPTALFNIVASGSPHAFKELTHLLIAGEAASPQAIQKVLENPNPPQHLWNAYGPTEATTMVSLFEVSLAETARGRISIGWPIGDTEIYLLDENLEPIRENGTAGELCVAGPGLSSGYLDQASENESRFIELSVELLRPDIQGVKGSKVRLYRTGDMAEWRQDLPGCLDFIGRRDRQVKHQGFRIELGEIERALASYKDLVSSTVVIRRPPVSPAGPSVLIAYVILRNPQHTAYREDLINHTRSQLPSYMIPDQILAVSGFPLTPNGKVDLQVLAANHNEENIPEANGVKPTTNGAVGYHDVLASIWRELLALPSSQPSERDDFFLLGGSSLQSAALITLIKQRTGRLLTMDEAHQFSRFDEMLHFIKYGKARQGNAPDDTQIWRDDVNIVDELLPLAPDWEAPDEGRVFITGVTGFVGVHLLRRLIELPGVKQVACLVRQKGSLPAAERIQKAMERYDLYPTSLALISKIMVLDGDMGDDNLGLTDERFDWLTNWASVVFHIGAKVNFCESYQEHRRSNVVGTKNVLKVAARGRRKAFHYMSSIDVWGPTGMTLGTSEVQEDGPLLPHIQALRYDLGYGQTQWTADAMVQRMRDHGLPVAIYRPGFILGDSRTGVSNPDDFVVRIIVGCIQLGLFPRIVNMRFEYGTVDFVVDSVLHIARDNKNLGRAYNVLSPDQDQSVTVEETCRLINETGRPVRMVEYSQWVEAAVAQQSPDGALAPLFPLLQEKVLGELTRWECAQHSPRYDTANYENAMRDSPDVKYIPFTSDILKRYIEFWDRKGFYHV